MTIKIIENIDHFNWKFSRVYTNLVLFSKRDTVTSLLFVPNFSETFFFSFPSIFYTPLFNAEVYKIEILHKEMRKKNSPNFHSINCSKDKQNFRIEFRRCLCDNFKNENRSTVFLQFTWWTCPLYGLKTHYFSVPYFVAFFSSH